MEKTRQARLASIGLTLLSVLAAVGGIAAGLLIPGPSAVYLLAFATLLILGGAYAQGTVPTEYGFDAETDTQRFRRELWDHLLSALLLGIVFVLVLIQGVAFLTGLGFFIFLGELFVLFALYYNAFVGFLLLVLASAVLVRNRLPSERLLSTADRNFGRGLLGFTVLVVVASLALGSGILQSLGITQVDPVRAPFLLTFGLFTLYLFVRTWLRYPRARDIGAWIEEEERFRRGNLPRAAVFSLSAFVVVAYVAAVALHYALGMSLAAVILAGLANLVLLVAPFGVGLTHVVEALERGLDDYDARRRRRRAVLVTGTILLAVLSVAAALLAVAALLSPGVSQLLVTNFPALMLGLGIASVATVLARTTVEAEDEFTERRKAVGAYLSAAVTVGTFFGIFLASEVAQGSLIGLANGIVLVLLGQAAAVFYVKNRLLLPSIVEMVQDLAGGEGEDVDEDIDVEDRIRRSMIAGYLVAMGLMLLGVVGIALTFTGFVPTPEEQGTKIGIGALWGIALLVALGFALYRHLQRANLETPAADEEAELYTRRLSQEEVSRYLILGFSASVAVILFVMGVLVQLQIVTSLGGLELAPRFSTDFFVFSLLLGLGPFGFYQSRRAAEIQAMDEKFPEFLRDLAESKRAGMTLTEAVITSSKGTYGELTFEIRKMAAQLEWGVAFTEALERFADRVRTPLIERSVTLIVQASNAGGNVIDVLTAAADDSREVQQILKERRDAMSIYVAIIYIAFFVFIGVIAVLTAQFIPEISKAVTEAARSGAPSIGGLQFSEIDEQAFKTLFFHAAVIQGFGGGIVAGVMSEGKPVQGLKHSFIMIIIAYVIFRFLIGG